MKVKNDHRSKFSNLSYWKEEALKNRYAMRIRWISLNTRTLVEKLMKQVNTMEQLCLGLI